MFSCYHHKSSQVLRQLGTMCVGGVYRVSHPHHHPSRIRPIIRLSDVWNLSFEFVISLISSVVNCAAGRQRIHMKESQHKFNRQVVNSQLFIPVIVTRCKHRHTFRLRSCSIRHRRYSNKVSRRYRLASKIPRFRWRLIDSKRCRNRRRHHHSQNIGSAWINHEWIKLIAFWVAVVVTWQSKHLQFSVNSQGIPNIWAASR